MVVSNLPLQSYKQKGDGHLLQKKGDLSDLLE